MNTTMGAKMAARPAALKYLIDVGRSRFNVRVFATGLLSLLGHSPTIAIREYSGQLNFPPESLEDASLDLIVKAGSLAVQDEISDKDRAEIERKMREEVLEVARFPEITFESRKVSGVQLGEGFYAVKIEGELSVHGCTRRQIFSAQLTAGEETLHAYGEVSLRQSDFNIVPVSFAGGALKLKDELKFSFDFIARKQG
jgi:polyisoprenoid-binding protein YceI